MVQWLRLYAANTGSMGSTPLWGPKIPHASQPKHQSMLQKRYYKKFNEDSKKPTSEKGKKEIFEKS